MRTEQEDREAQAGAGASGLLRRALGRACWAANPGVRLFYYASADALVAEIVDGPVTETVDVAGRLRVEFDGDGHDALPVTVCLTGVRGNPDCVAARLARQILGERVWALVGDLEDGDQGAGPIDVTFEAHEYDERLTAWWGLADDLRPRWTCFREGAFAVGVELFAGRLRAALVDSGGRVHGMAEVELRGNAPELVADQIARLVERLSRDRDTLVGVQLGGPVDDAGTVLFYDKPVAKGDVPWRRVDLASMVRERTGRDARVVNDAHALAELEVANASGTVETATRNSVFAVVLFGQGIGARLVHDGVVQPYPMELGVFVPNPWACIPRHRHPAAIESTASTVAIVAAVRENIDSEVGSIDDVAELANGQGPVAEKVRSILAEAGREIARGMAAAQALLDPRTWTVYAPAVLAHESKPAGRAFFDGLRAVNEFIGYDGLWNPRIEGRSMSGSLGARAAAAAALPAAGRRTDDTTDSRFGPSEP